MKFEFDAVVVSVGSRAGKDGKVYYHVNFEQDGEVFVFDCTEEVAKSVEKYKLHHFVGSYVKGEFNGRTYSRIGVLSSVLVK